MFLGHGHTPAFPRRWWSRSVAITFLEAGRVKKLTAGYYLKQGKVFLSNTNSCHSNIRIGYAKIECKECQMNFPLGIKVIRIPLLQLSSLNLLCAAIPHLIL